MRKPAIVGAIAVGVTAAAAGTFILNRSNVSPQIEQPSPSNSAQTRAATRLESNDVDGALAAYDEALRANPNDGFALLRKGQLLYLKQDWKTAAETFDVGRKGPELSREHLMWWALSRRRNGEKPAKSEFGELELRDWPNPVTAFVLSGDDTDLRKIMAKADSLGEEDRAAVLCKIGFASLALAQIGAMREQVVRQLDGIEKVQSFCQVGDPMEALIMQHEIERLKAH